MRIVFLSYNYSPDIYSPQEWIERIQFYTGWAQCLAKQHTIIRVDQINYQGQFIHNGIQYYFVDDGKRKNYFPRTLNRFVKELNPDVVIISSFLFPLQTIQLRGCLGNKVKIIIQHHAEKPFTGVKKYLQYRASRKANAFLFTARETGMDWVNHKNLDSSKKLHELMEVSSVFHPFDKITAQKHTGVNGAPVFLWVGRLNDNKDPLTAVKVFLHFAALQPNAKLYMIYHTEELAVAVKELLYSDKSGDAVVMIGKVPHPELLYWFNSADFFLSASHYEGSGTALCEAMSCGCIPVVTDIPSFRTICGDGGLLYEPGNEAALVAALDQTIHCNLEEQRNKVMDHFKKRLSFEAIAARFQLIAGSL